jgi:hypothetical protein
MKNVFPSSSLCKVSNGRAAKDDSVESGSSSRGEEEEEDDEEEEAGESDSGELGKHELYFTLTGCDGLVLKKFNELSVLGIEGVVIIGSATEHELYPCDTDRPTQSRYHAALQAVPA